MLGGYMGKYLRVNLTTRKIKEEPLPDESVLRKYIGGLGLGMRMLYAEVPPGVGPYDPGTNCSSSPALSPARRCPAPLI